MKRFLVLLICLTALAGCGGGGGGVSAPDGSSITINPGSLSIADPHDFWRTTNFTISVKNADGQPMGDAKIAISFPYAVPDSHGYVQLYDGTTAKNSPFDAKTDEFGVYNLRFDFRAGVAYTGDLEVRSGSAFGTSTFTMTTE